MPPAYWLPVVLWMAVIFVLSSDTASADHTNLFVVPLLGWVLPWAPQTQLQTLHGLVRKLAHFTEYAVLAALWYRALLHGRQLGPGIAAWGALALSIVWAVLDEVHQASVPTRTASVGDVAVDTLGAGVAIVLARLVGHARRSAPSRGTVPQPRQT